MYGEVRRGSAVLVCRVSGVVRGVDCYECRRNHVSVWGRVRRRGIDVRTSKAELARVALCACVRACVRNMCVSTHRTWWAHNAAVRMCIKYATVPWCNQARQRIRMHI